MIGLRTTSTWILAALAAPVAGAMASEPGATGSADPGHRALLEIRVGDEEPRRITASGALIKGELRFIGEHQDPAGRFVVDWNWTADLDPTGDARIDGKASITNLTDDRHVYDLRAAFRLDPVIMHGSKIGGSVRVTLEMDEDGGVIDCPMGESLWEISVDDASARRLHTGPFMMGGGGAGTAVADSNFGAPWPGQDAPAIERGVTIRHHGRITSGDRAIFQSALVVGGDPDHFVQRRDVESPVRVGARRDGRRVIELGGGRSGGSVRGGSRGRDAAVSGPAGGNSVSKNRRKRSKAATTPRRD